MGDFNAARRFYQMVRDAEYQSKRADGWGDALAVLWASERIAVLKNELAAAKLRVAILESHNAFDDAVGDGCDVADKPA